MRKRFNPAKMAIGVLVSWLLPLIVVAFPTADDTAKEWNAGVVDFLHEGSDNIERAIQLGKRRIAFEVAENGLKFGFDQGQPLDQNGFPLYGNNFITQGYIYPAGTLTCFPQTGCNGVLADGSPEFPDKVLGTWICRGWVFGDTGFNIASGPVVATTQIYDFHEVSGQFGKITIVSDGTELVDVNVPILRAVTGGTGPYQKARGQVEQTLLGLNVTQGVSLKFQLEVK